MALRDKDPAVLRETVCGFPVIREARVFGSRATGQAHRASDIELALDAPDATPRERSEIWHALEHAPFIYEIDLVRPEQTVSRHSKERIDREGISIYPERNTSES